MVRLCAHASELCVFGVLACGSAHSTDVNPADAGVDDAPPEFCAHSGADQVRDLFCLETPARIQSLGELEQRLGLAFTGHAAVAGANGYPDAAVEGTTSGTAYEAVTLLGHSTALSGRFVSPINPRAIILGLNTFLAFNRGVQQVELVSVDRNTAELNFYLITFEQACNRKGCKPGDLFTPRIESDWVATEIRDAEGLKNTPFDCRQCHQRGRDAPILLMRELHGPWTHFFAPEQTGSNQIPEVTGSDLLNDYLNAKGTESYAGIPTDALRSTLGFTLEGVVPQPQPLVFDGTTIMDERWPSSPAGFAATPQRSATWYAAYEAFKRGEQLALPYFDPRATDVGKEAALTAAIWKTRATRVPCRIWAISSPMIRRCAQKWGFRPSPAQPLLLRSFRRAVPVTTTCSIRASRGRVSALRSPAWPAPSSTSR
jgi:hypothetical protein